MGDCAVSFDYKMGRHAFDLSTGICEKCDMTWAQFEANGETQCAGRSQEPSPKRDWRDHWIFDVLNALTGIAGR
jgi:hypothetical protein